MAHTGVEDIGLDIRLAKDRSILTQLFLGLLEILERPGVPIAHNVGVAGHSVDGEAAHHLVEFSIHGHDVEEMGHKILAAELAVIVDERPQIQENALASYCSMGRPLVQRMSGTLPERISVFSC